MERTPEHPYVLTRDHIHGHDRLPVPELLSERLAALGWPLELQGTGKTHVSDRRFELHYPLGDALFSFATAIHELGHLRQDEISTPESIQENEVNAYARGWAGATAYAPDTMRILDQQIDALHQSGKITNFHSFADLYTWFRDLGLTVSGALDSIPEQDDEDAFDRAQEQALRAAGIERRFQEFNLLRTGKTVDRNFIEDFILQVAERIAAEQYG